MRDEIVETQQEKLHIDDVQSDVVDVFFSLDELKRTMKQGKDTSPGRDGLGYQLFKQVEGLLLQDLLSLFNKV